HIPADAVSNTHPCKASRRPKIPVRSPRRRRPQSPNTQPPKRPRPNTPPHETSPPELARHPNSPAARRPTSTTREDPCRRPVFTLVILQQLFGHQSARFRAFS
uniref:Uncharacterized protein n=1 Tax=Cucumis melo TaxID=3656 RepID=A0A9I9EH27_CUCME